MKKLAALFFVILLSACGQEAVEKPSHLLGKDEMADLLYDLSLLQAMNSYVPKQVSDKGVDTRKYIYEKYGIDSLTFAQNHKYYASVPEEYQKIQRKVAERLKNKKAETDSLVKHLPKTKVPIKRLKQNAVIKK